MNGLSCKTRRPGPLSGKAATEGEEGVAALETGWGFLSVPPCPPSPDIQLTGGLLLTTNSFFTSNKRPLLIPLLISHTAPLPASFRAFIWDLHWPRIIHLKEEKKLISGFAGSKNYP